MRAFNEPAIFAKAAAVFGTAIGDRSRSRVGVAADSHATRELTRSHRSASTMT